MLFNENTHMKMIYFKIQLVSYNNACKSGISMKKKQKKIIYIHKNTTLQSLAEAGKW